MAHQEALSFCRICMGSCGMVLALDEQRRLVSIHGDRDDPQTLGFACFKGLRAPEQHGHAGRIIRPLKRLPDGSRVEIGLEQALDEIAERLSAIREAHGGEAIAGYKGSAAFYISSAAMLLNEWLQALGSPKTFSSITIDQSAKLVAPGRMGVWPAGLLPDERCDVMMLVGTNPMVTVNPPFDTRNPVKRMKAARERGMKLIVVDPRRTETAAFADLHLRPLPGEDAPLFAGMIRLMLENGWYDRDFCAAHVADLDALRAAVAPFTPAVVEARADVPAGELEAAARLFAGSGLRGVAAACTGPNMGAHSNLAEHLVEALNVLTGSLLREGERIPNPGAILPGGARRAQVIPAARPWEHGPRSRIDGSGMLFGEMMTGIMADEILQPGEGQVRALIVHGGNPASAVPDQRKIVRALRSLDLLVCIEPTMTVTAELADYILPPKLQYERADLHMWLFETFVYRDSAYARYTPPVVEPPAGSEVTDDWYVFWSLAKRMGLPLTYLGEPLDMERPPTTDELLARVARHAATPFDEIRRHPRGVVVDDSEHIVEPAEAGWAGRFTLAPDDVCAELGQAYVESAARAAEPGFRLAVRRLREAYNSVGRDLPTTHKRVPYNPAWLNPDDMAELSIGSGDEVEIRSAKGAIMAVARADPTLRRGVISISHGFGGLPDAASNRGYYETGVSPNLLLDGEKRETINAMPQMTGIAVSVQRIGPGRSPMPLHGSTGDQAGEVV